MIDYGAILQLVNSEMAQAGQTITFVKTTGVNVDSDKPWKTDQSGLEVNTEYDAIAVSVPVSSVQDMGFKATTQDLLKNSERVFIVAPGDAGQDLRTYNFVIANGLLSKIDVIDSLQPTDMILLYVVGVSR